MAEQPRAEPVYATAKDKTSLPWYRESIDWYLVPQTQELLDKYSGIPRDQQSKHVHEIREEAWSIRAYPCTGLGLWLNPYICRSPAYSTIIERLKSGGSMLDVGAFLGGDFRQCVFDGAPSDRLYGIDIVSHWDVGYKLYRDRDQFKGKLLVADINADGNPELDALHEKMDIISISAVLHQWDWQKQLSTAKRLVRFSSGKDAIVIGHQVGNLEAQEIELMNTMTYRHTPDSWANMWKEVGEETGTKWESQARLLTWEDIGWDAEDVAWMEPGARVLDFVVTRIE